MLQIGPDLLPQSLLSYVAFRVALRTTWDLLERTASGEAGVGGFLTEVPFLQEMPPHIQLDALAATWQKHLASERCTADLLDEAIVYAVGEFAARLCERDPQQVLRALRCGPFDVAVPVDHALASELRGLYLRLSNAGDFLLIGQCLDMSPDESAEWKRQVGIDEQRLESLFDALGRWHVSPQFRDRLNGLATHAEATELARQVGSGVKV